MIQLKHIEIGFGRKAVAKTAHDIQLQAYSDRGKVICMLGPNGCGKSTLLHAIAFQRHILNGKVIIGNDHSELLKPAQLAETIAVVLTERQFSHHLTVMDMMKLGRSPHSGSWNRLKEEDWQKINAITDLFQLEALSGRRLDQLSDGQLQRVLIARALVQDTPVLLMDEPTGHLDVHHRAEILQALRTYCLQTNKLLVFSSHEIALSLSFADEVIYFHDGQIFQEDVDRFRESDILTKMFPSNLLRYDNQQGEFFVKKK